MSCHILADELADVRNVLLQFREDGCKVMPPMRHVLPDRQFHRHVSRLGALDERVGIIEQRFDGAHLDQMRRKTAEIGMNGRREGDLRRVHMGASGTTKSSAWQDAHQGGSRMPIAPMMISVT
jgi:hypothetical protein